MSIFKMKLQTQNMGPRLNWLGYILKHLYNEKCAYQKEIPIKLQRVALMLRNLGLNAIPLHGQLSQVK
jgi:hypothetical protein